MDSSHQNYLNHFKRFSPHAVGNVVSFRGLSDYSTYINNKANEIISKAAGDKSVDSTLLQKEIFQMGVDYVKVFVLLHKKEKTYRM